MHLHVYYVCASISVYLFFMFVWWICICITLSLCVIPVCISVYRHTYLCIYEWVCLSHYSIVVKRHQDQVYPNKRKHWNVDLLVISEISPLWSRWGTWQYLWRWRNSWEFFILIQRQWERKTGPDLGFWNLKAYSSSTFPPIRPHLPQ